MVCRRTRETLIADRIDVTNQRLEIHHKNPHFMGGNGDRWNLMPVTLPEHALEHLADALTSETRKEAAGHFAAVSLIVRRMSIEEKREFSRCTK